MWFPFAGFKFIVLNHYPGTIPSSCCWLNYLFMQKIGLHINVQIGGIVSLSTIFFLGDRTAPFCFVTIYLIAVGYGRTAELEPVSWPPVTHCKL